MSRAYRVVQNLEASAIKAIKPKPGRMAEVVNEELAMPLSRRELFTKLFNRAATDAPKLLPQTPKLYGLKNQPKTAEEAAFALAKLNKSIPQQESQK